VGQFSASAGTDQPMEAQAAIEAIANLDMRVFLELAAWLL
jgi:hypothetical protein